MREINRKMNSLWEEEEVYWYQRAKVNWLNMGIEIQKNFINQLCKRGKK